MKKLMIALAAAATAMFSFGDSITHGADFEANGYVAGENFTNYVNKADDGATPSGNRYWYSTSEDIGVISNHSGGTVCEYTPDFYATNNQANAKFLNLDTTVPLFRTIANNDQSGDFTGVSISEGDGVYLDTLVKFTAADEVFGTNSLDAVDKIAIEYVEREADPEKNIEPLTNFVVRAGFIGSELFATNYAVALPADWLANNKKDDWHRLTVRTLTNISGTGKVGFKIYLDNAVMSYVTDNAEFARSAGFQDDTHTIFPSAVDTDKNNYNSISAVAFSGNGSIDDVVFTTTMPDFIKSSENVVATFTADSGVTGISVQVGSEEPIAVDMDTLTATFDPGTTEFTVTATINADGYEFAKMTVGSDEYTTNPANVTNYAGGTIAITTTRNNVTYIDGEDQQQSSSSLATALAAAKAGSTITLAYSVDVADIEGSAFETYEITSGKNLVLDLNGKTITWNDDLGEEALFTVKAGASFRVIDSSVANTGAIVYTGEYVVFYNKGNCYIGATTGDKGPTIQGKLAAKNGEAQIVRGKFDKATNGTVEFTWADYIEEGSELVESLGDYWIVQPQGGSGDDWPETPSSVSGQTAEAAFGITGDLANADAAVLATWAKAKGVNYSDRTTAILTDAFLLNCANTQAAIDEATEEFTITSITVDGDTVTITPADNADYGNGKVVIESAAALTTPMVWREKTAGDHFFRATLVVKPVATP